MSDALAQAILMLHFALWVGVWIGIALADLTSGRTLRSALQAQASEIALKNQTIEGLQEKLQSAEEDAAGYANEAERIEQILAKHLERGDQACRRTEATEAKLREAVEVIRPFAAIPREGVVTTKTGHVKLTTCAEYFHEADAFLATMEKPGG